MAVAASMLAWPALPTTAADAGEWTLEAATRRVLELAPERRASEAEVAARAAELKQAGSWPNPSIDLRADDKLGQEDGRGGTDLTRLGLSQPLPFRRLSRQRTAAEAALRGTEANRRAQQLQLEQETARVFYALQLAAARLKLAQDRLALAADYPDRADKRTKRDPLVRYLTPLERQRLAVLAGLATALVVERNVLAPLIAAFGIPGRFTMPDEVDFRPDQGCHVILAPLSRRVLSTNRIVPA